MTTALSIIDWLTSLNKWQMTLLVTASLAAWIAGVVFCARLIEYGKDFDDDSDDDAEGER